MTRAEWIRFGLATTALAGGVAAWFAVQDYAATDPPPGGLGSVHRSAGGGPAKLVGQPPAAENLPQIPIGKHGEPPQGAAVFPDGTWLEPINGVKEAPPFPGFNGRPYAPVVQIYTNPTYGIQYYVHADGTVSNTQMAETSDGTRTWMEATWLVGHPVPTQPIR
ncbi:MAG: hypothetical protein AAF628_04775 [Planctomycetota bacterium]